MWKENIRVAFNPLAEIENITSWIRDYFCRNGDENTKAVIGISGGKDSTIAAALLVRALGKERVIGVLMPQNTQADIDDSRKVCEMLEILSFEVDIGPACTALYRAIDENDYDGMVSKNTMVATNTPARIRMATLYAIAALHHGRVCNTCNASERYVGYSTKYGDNAGDFALFHDYTVTELYDIGDALGLPYKFVHKTPADGMQGKSDEDVIGATYEQIDRVIRNNDPNRIPFDRLQIIQSKHKYAKHKNDAVRLPHPDRDGGEWF